MKLLSLAAIVVPTIALAAASNGEHEVASNQRCANSVPMPVVGDSGIPRDPMPILRPDTSRSDHMPILTLGLCVDTPFIVGHRYQPGLGAERGRHR